MNSEETLYFALLCKFSKGVGNIKGEKILSQEHSREKLYKESSPSLHSKVKKEIENIYKHRVNTTTILDADYPHSLRNIYNSPLILYYYGTLPTNFCFAVVGTRTPSKYGVTTTQLIISQLAEFRVPIVSGFAYGIDVVAHQSALENDIPTIAVLGTGLDVQYPSMNTWMRKRIVEGGGCLITEFSLGSEAIPSNFPKRNRIISGLSDGILVVEAANRSGSLITAELGLEQGKNIFTIPGTVFGDSFKGNHKLVRLGATLVENGYQILSEYKEFEDLVKDKESYQNPTYRDIQTKKESLSTNKKKDSPKTPILSEKGKHRQWEKEELSDGSEELKRREVEKVLESLDEVSLIIYNSVKNPATLEEIMVITGIEEPGKILSMLTGLILKGLVDERGGLYYPSK